MSPPPIPPRRNLLILRAGDRSLHPSFFIGEGPRNWDLHISYFGAKDAPNLCGQSDVTWSRDGGFKFNGLAECVANHPFDFSRYDFIATPDDDVIMTKQDWNRFFDIAHAHNLQVASASINPFSFWEHTWTVTQPGMTLRFVKRIEPLIGAFRREVFQRLVPYLAMKDNIWAIDHIIPALTHGPKAIAVIDAVSIFHTRMQRSGATYAGVGTDIESSLSIMTKMLADNGLPFVEQQALGGIDKRGRAVSRTRLDPPNLLAIRALRRWRRARNITNIAAFRDETIYVKAKYPGVPPLPVDPSIR